MLDFDIEAEIISRNIEDLTEGRPQRFKDFSVSQIAVYAANCNCGFELTICPNKIEPHCPSCSIEGTIKIIKAEDIDTNDNAANVT